MRRSIFSSSYLAFDAISQVAVIPARCPTGSSSATDLTQARLAVLVSGADADVIAECRNTQLISALKCHTSHVFVWCLCEGSQNNLLAMCHRLCQGSGFAGLSGDPWPGPKVTITYAELV